MKLEPDLREAATMSIYVLRGKYSSEALKGMMASPEDREAAIAKVVEKAGGKLIGYYVTFGDDDWLVIIDCPSNEAALSIAVVAAAGGSVADTKTTVAMTTKQAMAAFKAAGELAQSFKSAGR
jgi:uncharacterized protein with GYD domain